MIHIDENNIIIPAVIAHNMYKHCCCYLYNRDKTWRCFPLFYKHFRKPIVVKVCTSYVCDGACVCARICV